MHGFFTKQKMSIPPEAATDVAVPHIRAWLLLWFLGVSISAWSKGPFLPRDACLELKMESFSFLKKTPPGDALSSTTCLALLCRGATYMCMRMQSRCMDFMIPSPGRLLSKGFETQAKPLLCFRSLNGLIFFSIVE